MTEAAESPMSRIAQLTRENSRLKESLEYIIRMSDGRLNEFRACQEELHLKDKKIRHSEEAKHNQREQTEIYDREIKQKEKENRRLKENIEEQKRSSLEKEKQLLKRIGELKEELTRLKESYRKEM